MPHPIVLPVIGFEFVREILLFIFHVQYFSCPKLRQRMVSTFLGEVVQSACQDLRPARKGRRGYRFRRPLCRVGTNAVCHGV